MAVPDLLAAAGPGTSQFQFPDVLIQKNDIFIPF